LTFYGRFWQNPPVAAPQDSFYVELGKRIRDARKQRGFTQDKLARALKLTRTSITNIEAGKQPVFAHQLIVFARTLAVPVETLLRTAETQPAPKLDAKLEKLPLADDQRDWVKRIAKTPTS
jgi:transcriptional regulator with XRE-family HTH domain